MIKRSYVFVAFCDVCFRSIHTPHVFLVKLLIGEQDCLSSSSSHWILISKCNTSFKFEMHKRSSFYILIYILKECVILQCLFCLIWCSLTFFISGVVAQHGFWKQCSCNLNMCCNKDILSLTPMNNSDKKISISDQSNSDYHICYNYAGSFVSSQFTFSLFLPSLRK